MMILRGDTLPVAAHAKRVAACAHEHQKYNGGPYTDHLQAVRDIVNPYGETTWAIAWLHDVVEDTECTVADLEAEFGYYIATCVSCISDDPRKGRKQRKAEANERCKDTPQTFWAALIVKAADRLANIRASIETENSDLLKMYLSEHRGFVTAMYRDGLGEYIWNELTDIVDHANKKASREELRWIWMNK